MQTQTQTKNAKSELIVKVKNIKGTSFVGVRNYENLKGEESNQTFNVGVTYANVLQYDLNALRNFDIQTLADKHALTDLTKAYAELIFSLEKRTADEQTKADLLKANDSTMKRSEAQSEAYIHIAKGLKAKLENDSMILYIYGFMVRKTILKNGEYKQVNSRPLTLAKNAITKAAGLKEAKYRNFKLGKLEDIKISGVTIKI
jgi:hypothetical protein